MHKIFLSVVCCIVLTFSFTSCQHNEIYYHFGELKNGLWTTNDTLVFDIDTTVFELNVPYDVTLEVTNNVNYPYRNIWFFVQHNFANDSVYVDCSKEFFLADESGKWTGSGFGSLYQTSFPLDKTFTFTEKRNYRIKVIHGMRDNTLHGIEKVGIRISKRQ